jgi:ferritin-like protein
MPTSVGLHEDAKLLKQETIERHRANVSLGEELEAIDWYDQRVDASQDGELRKILAHNRDEEKEHAAMNLEWLRRHDPKFDAALRTYLFTEGSIVGLEKAAEQGDGAGGGGGGGDAGDGSLGIGSLKR